MRQERINVLERAVRICPRLYSIVSLLVGVLDALMFRVSGGALPAGQVDPTPGGKCKFEFTFHA
jgi:hypothetical protein